jgi:UDP-4-amino-4,6-dideoxy-N-acetyl-beta-L-altrosamine N-acetyltransferase
MIKLRERTFDDDPLIVAWRNDSTGCFFSDEDITLASHRHWFENQRWGTTQFYFIAESDGAPVGTVSLYNVNSVHLRGEYGRLLVDYKRRGEGLGYETMTALLAFAFQDLGLNRVYGDVLRRNTAAISLTKRLGFIQEGVFREHVNKEGHFLDVVRVGILREEWQEDGKV